MSTEVSGPFATYEDLLEALGPGHPINAETDEDLVWFDGPRVSIVRAPGDGRPRLDVSVRDERSGAEGDVTYRDVRHQLVFDTEGTLRATLHRGGAPTRETYAMAERVIRYETSCTAIGHPRPSHSAVTAVVPFDGLPDGEAPNGDLEADGLPVPGRRGSS